MEKNPEINTRPQHTDILKETSAHLNNAEINIRRYIDTQPQTIGSEIIAHIESAERLVELMTLREKRRP